MARIRRVDSEREMERMVDEYVTKGYNIKSQSQFSSKVKEKDWGQLPVHVFLFLFVLISSAILFSTAGTSSGGAWVIAILSNITYMGYSWFSAEEVVIKVDGAAGSS